MRIFTKLSTAALLTVLTAINANAYDLEDGGIYYTLDLEEMTASVVAKGDGTKYTGEVQIPETVTKSGKLFTVNVIEKKAFYDCDGLTSISIPKTLLLVNDGAFYGCDNLAEVVLPDDLYAVGNGAFEYCSGLKKLVLPKSQTILLTWAFAHCTGLEELVIPDGWTELGHEDCDEFFSNCTSLKKVTFGTGLTKINDEAFMGCSQLSEITFKSDENLTTLGEYVFSGTAVTDNRFLPKSLETIPQGTFSGCEKMTEIYVPTGVTKVECAAFPSSTMIKSVYIEDGETELDMRCTFECMPEKVYIGRPVTNAPYYPNRQFMKNAVNKNYLKQLTLGANFTLTEKKKNVIDVGDGLQWICSKSTNPENIYAEFSKYVYANVPLYVPATVIEFYKTTAPWSNFFDVRDIATLDPNAAPEQKEVSGSYDFEDGGIYYTYDLEEMTASVVAKGDGTKYTGEVLIPETVTKGGKLFTVNVIEKKAFYDCDGLTSVSIPKTLLLVNDYAFYDCDNLTEVVLPDGLYAVGNGAFEYCDAMKKLVLPKSQALLLTWAFAYCEGLEELVIPDDWTELGHENCYGFFSKCTSLKKVTFGTGLTKINNQAFSDCSQLSEIIFKSDENFTTLGEYVFSGTAVTDNRFLPKSLETIPQGTFSGCEKMTEIYVPANIKTIEGAAFPSSTMIKSVYIDDSETELELGYYLECKPEDVYIGRPVTNSPFYPSNYLYGNNKNYMKKLTLGASFTLTEKNKKIITVGDGLEWICSHSTHPENIYAEFSNYIYVNVPLYVPSVAIADYKATAPWSKFFDVRDEVTMDPNAIVISDPYEIAATLELVGANEQLVQGTTANVKVKVSNKSEKDYNGPLRATLVKKTGEEWNNIKDVDLKTPLTVGVDAEETLTFEGLEIGGIYNVVIRYQSSSEWKQAGETKSFQMVEPSYDLEATVTVSDLIDEGETHYRLSGDVSFEVSIRNPSAFLYEDRILLKLVTDDGKYVGEQETSISIKPGDTGKLTATFEADVTEVGKTYYVDAYYQRRGNMETCGHSPMFTVVKVGRHELKGTVSVVSPILTEEGATQVGSEQLIYMMINNNTTSAYDGGMVLRLMQKAGDEWQQVFETEEHIAVEGLKNTALEYNFTDLVTDHEYRVEAYYYSLDQLTAFGTSNSWRMVSESPYIISFKDPEVKRICVERWDTNEDRHLSYEEAAAVTDFDYVFEGSEITSFDELQYFTGIEKLNDFEFNDCKKLTSVVIPATMTEISAYAFYHCEGLKDLILSEGVTKLGDSAFGNCYSLETVTIPSTVTFIDNRAFSYTNSLKSVISLVKNPFEISYDTFSILYEDEYIITDEFTNATLYVPAGCKAMYEETSGWDNFKKIVEMDGPTLGDVNGDGAVDAKDIVEVTNYLGGKPSAAFDMSAADLNGDGKIDISDILRISLIIRSMNK